MGQPLVIDAADLDEVSRMDARLADVPLAEQPADRDFTPAELHAIYVAAHQLAVMLGTVMLRPNPPRQIGMMAGAARTAANVARRRLIRAGHPDPHLNLWG